LPLILRPLHPLLGAEVRGIDLTQSTPPDAFAEIEAALDRHAVLVFPGQRLDDEQLLAFTRHFGTLERIPYHIGKDGAARSEIGDFSNLEHDGSIMAANSPQRAFRLGNQLWHTDSLYRHVSAKCTLLLAREIPRAGGETEFADMRAAYDALPEARQRELEGLIVEHSMLRSRSQVGFTGFTEQAIQALPPVRHALVRRHPGSGRKTLFLGSTASHVIGWPLEEGRKLVEELIAFATQPQFVYQHRWTMDDLVLWDDRCTMHRVLPFDDLRHRRRMRRTSVADVANTVEQAARG
jgi:alpha-ketoglutarate-dependent 2,4-dichlorophenoxyacetate dioxygenase